MINFLDLRKSDKKELLDKLSSRNVNTAEDYTLRVKEIIDSVKKDGDNAVIKYTAMFDWSGMTKEKMKVTREEIDEAYNLIDVKIKNVIKHAAERVKRFHEKQKQNSWFDSNEKGVLLGQFVRALGTVGLYVPGGKAAYPSSVIMTAVPAKTAGVERLIITTPPGKDGKINPAILVAAKEAGVDEIYKVGGAQAVAAMAFGTEIIPRVDKIVGPGNIYVTIAKKLVYGIVDIDMMAGPSEILVIADESANPEYVAADLLSQAEHDEMASSILVTTSEKLANEVKTHIKRRLEMLPRKEIVEKSLRDYGFIVICKSLDEAVETANMIAPEHVELCINNPVEYLGQIKNAGAIFVGNYSPEPLGDYLAGPSHVIPTSGTARFYSPVSVDQFIKKTSLIWFEEEAMKTLGNDVISFAELEKFEAHAQSLRVRMDK